MRFARSVTVLAVVAALGAGCGGEGKNVDDAIVKATSTPSDAASSGAVGSSEAPAAANTKDVCATATSMVQKAAEGMTGPVSDMVRAEVQGDQAGAQAAREKLKKIFVDASVQLREQADKAADPALVSALNDAATAYKAAGEAFASGQPEAAADPKFNSAGEALGKICGA